jgi:nitric oxide reductase NorD protein
VDTLAGFLAGFSDPKRAAMLYHGLETLRVRYFLDRELPGLMRAARGIFNKLGSRMERDKTGIITGLQAAVCRQKIKTETLARVVEELAGKEATPANSLSLSILLYDQFDGDEDSDRQPFLPFQGRLRLAEVQAAREKQRTQAVESFVEAMALYLVQLPQIRSLLETGENMAEGGEGSQGDAAVVFEREEQGGRQGAESYFLTIANESAELPESLHQEIRNLDELGLAPDRFISSAVGRAGHFLASGEGGRKEERGEEALVSQHSYDEWDFRRNGFRKNWCLLTEQELPSTRSSFVQTTLGRYHGQIMRLRHQFEMMRTRERFLRRRRDGDDIDLDALVESLADTRAGLPPSDRLFIRLQRDERDIAALFLVDMSNSTEGWVGTAIKESLVLLCEAMESLGDRYGIYGFSGMRRLRCEIFPVKELDEPYDNRVHRRIGAIGPREYTRMAPAIRHMIQYFQQVDARVRLLITLSDGKPEDYDDYKGEYAIEDTRHALLEAAAAGIHPFSITIDHHAHEYMEHMCGRGNYIFLDDVARLPARMPEIYRVLTT